KNAIANMTKNTSASATPRTWGGATRTAVLGQGSAACQGFTALPARPNAHLGLAIVEHLGDLHKRVRQVVHGHDRQADPVEPATVPRRGHARPTARLSVPCRHPPCTAADSGRTQCSRRTRLAGR